jgi:hypothetical protein
MDETKVIAGVEEVATDPIRKPPDRGEQDHCP